MIFKNCRHLLSLLICLILILPVAHSKEPPFQIPSQQEVNKIRSVHIKTNKGTLYFELFPELAPIHVANFKYLADQGHYQGVKFKTYFDNHIIQARPTKKLKYSLPPEFSQNAHKRGSLGMARWEDVMNPERRSSPDQFYMLVKDAKHMEKNYTIFGSLVKGWSVLDQLESGDTILELTVYIRP